MEEILTLYSYVWMNKWKIRFRAMV